MDARTTTNHAGRSLGALFLATAGLLVGCGSEDAPEPPNPGDTVVPADDATVTFPEPDTDLDAPADG